MTEIKLIHSGDLQVKNRNKRLYYSYNKNLRDIENYLINTEAKIYVIAGDLFEYDIPNDSERKLIYNHISRCLNITTLKELVIIAGNHDLIKDKKLNESNIGYNPLNIFADMLKNLDSEKTKKLSYFSESKVYQSKVHENIQYLVYSLEDKMDINFEDADPNKLKFVLFHDMLKEYVDSVKLPLRKDIKDALLSVDSFPSDTIILAADIHKNLKYEGLDNQVFYYPGSPQQHTHSEGSYIKIGNKVNIKDAEPKALKLFTFDPTQYENTISHVIGVEDLPLTTYVSYVTLTLDHKMVTRSLKQVELAGDLGLEDGTAIGLGIANAANMLANSEAESKVVILLTDGVNNAGEIDPLTAAEVAKALGIKVYTIGAAKPGQVPVPVPSLLGGTDIVYQESVLDEAILQQVADNTGGRYYRAEDTAGLQAIYDEINNLEKSQVEVQVYNNYTELFGLLLVPALLLLLLEMFLRRTTFRTIP